MAGVCEFARREGVSGSYATRLVRAAFLAPDILAAILEGEQPDDLTAARLLRACRRGLPLDWREQRALLSSCCWARLPRRPGPPPPASSCRTFVQAAGPFRRPAARPGATPA